MTYHRYILLFGAGSLLLSCSQTKKSNDFHKPNIVFVMADDLGIGDLGCFGQTMIETPVIDKLFTQSLIFDNHYSGSTVSAPSRCCLMTGQHTGHTDVRGNETQMYDGELVELDLPDDAITVAEILKEQGYSTMCVGKWGLGAPHGEGSPLNQGFDYFAGYYGQWPAHHYYPDHLYENEEKIQLDGMTYSHNFIMDKGLQFIEEHSDGPFFAYFALTLPHAELAHPDLSQYDGSFKEVPFLNDPTGLYSDQEKPRAAYASMVTEIDNSVGRIIDLLKKKGIWENTIFIFTSDNGVHFEGGHDPDYFNSNGPFRGYKRDLYEGGIRTPFILSWPAVIKEGRHTDHVSAFWDFLPTVAEVSGGSIPEGIDGISYLPELLGEKGQKQHDYLYFEFHEQGGRKAIIKDNWKLIQLNINTQEKPTEELYFLKDDISEMNNRINDNPSIAAELRALMSQARTDNPVYKFK